MDPASWQEGFAPQPPSLTGVTFTNRLNGDAFLTDAVAHNGSGVAIGDVNGDGAATYQDLILILGAWGPCGSPCPTDLDGNGVTGYQDLLVVLANWFG